MQVTPSLVYMSVTCRTGRSLIWQVYLEDGAHRFPFLEAAQAEFSRRSGVDGIGEYRTLLLPSSPGLICSNRFSVLIYLLVHDSLCKTGFVESKSESKSSQDGDGDSDVEPSSVASDDDVDAASGDVALLRSNKTTRQLDFIIREYDCCLEGNEDTFLKRASFLDVEQVIDEEPEYDFVSSSGNQSNCSTSRADVRSGPLRKKSSFVDDGMNYSAAAVGASGALKAKKKKRKEVASLDIFQPSAKFVVKQKCENDVVHDDGMEPTFVALKCSKTGDPSMLYVGMVEGLIYRYKLF